MDKAEKNLQEWDKLYQSTSQRIWGEEPVGFLQEYTQRFASELTAYSTILDAGTGEGRNLKLIAELPGLLHAVDGSTNALANRITLQETLPVRLLHQILLARSRIF